MIVGFLIIPGLVVKTVPATRMAAARIVLVILTMRVVEPIVNATQMAVAQMNAPTPDATVIALAIPMDVALSAVAISTMAVMAIALATPTNVDWIVPAIGMVVVTVNVFATTINVDRMSATGIVPAIGMVVE